MAEEADVVIGAGDFATMRQGLESTIEALSAIAVPAVLVPGNAETDIELWQACAPWTSAQVLHGQDREIEGVQFFGLGGGGRGGRDPISVDFRPQRGGGSGEARELPRGGGSGRSLTAEGVPGRVRRSAPRERIDPDGDRAQRRVLGVCGHIHDCWGREATIGTTPVVNVGGDGRFFEV
jgi:uncharacterized protein